MNANLPSGVSRGGHISLGDDPADMGVGTRDPRLVRRDDPAMVALRGLVATGVKPRDAVAVLGESFGRVPAISAVLRLAGSGLFGAGVRSMVEAHRIAMEVSGIDRLIAIRGKIAELGQMASAERGFPEIAASLRDVVGKADGEAQRLIRELHEIFSDVGGGGVLSMAAMMSNPKDAMGLVSTLSDLVGGSAGVAAIGIVAKKAGRLEVVVRSDDPSVFAILENVFIPCGLDLSGNAKLAGLPRGMVIAGSLRLKDCQSMVELPDGLRVGEHLNLTGCASLSSLPPGLRVRAVTIRGCPSWDGRLPQGAVIDTVHTDAFPNGRKACDVWPESMSESLHAGG